MRCTDQFFHPWRTLVRISHCNQYSVLSVSTEHMPACHCSPSMAMNSAMPENAASTLLPLAPWPSTASTNPRHCRQSPPTTRAITVNSLLKACPLHSVDSSNPAHELRGLHQSLRHDRQHDTVGCILIDMTPLHPNMRMYLGGLQS